MVLARGEADAHVGGSMTGRPPSYSATCRHCGRVTVTAERFTDAELARLRDHVRQAHRHEAVPTDAGVAETLRQFDMERVP